MQALFWEKMKTSIQQLKRSKYLPKRRQPLTVCIAAICHGGTMIVGASDRMITSGEDREFEVPTLSETRQIAPVLKTVRLDNYVVAMTSGDSGFQADAMQEVLIRFNEIKQKHPSSRVRVRDAARLYVDFCNEA